MPARPGDVLRFAVLGDSTAAGLGVDRPEQLPGVVLARGLAEETGRDTADIVRAIPRTTDRPTKLHLQGAVHRIETILDLARRHGLSAQAVTVFLVAAPHLLGLLLEQVVDALPGRRRHSM